MIGHYQRKFPKGAVLRGWDTMNPTAPSFSLPIYRASDVDSGDEIWAGQLMSLTPDGTAWRLGVPASNANTGVLAFAYQDFIDDDVEEADLLLGLPCSGQFRFATPYFAHYKKDGTTLCSYTAGTPLTYCVNSEDDDKYDVVANGTVVTKSRATLAGFIRPAEAGDVVIGTVAQTGSGPYASTEAYLNQDGYKNLNRNAIPFVGTATPYHMPAGVWPLQPSVASAVDSSSLIDNAYYVVWDTCYRPAAPTA